MDRSEYIQQQDAKAERAGRDHFNAFNQLFSTDEVKEGACNMTAEGEYCPEHGMNECGGGMMYEGTKSEPYKPDPKYAKPASTHKYRDISPEELKASREEYEKKHGKTKHWAETPHADSLKEDLQADDGEHYEDSDDFFGKFEADHFDKEEESDDGMEVRGYIDGVNVMAWRFDDESKTSGYGVYNDDMLSECGMPGSMGPAEQDSGMNINSSMDTKTGRKTLSVTADGEAAEQLAQVLKMAGLAGTHDHDHDHEGHGKVVLVTRGGGEEVAEDFANEPNQQYASTDTIVDAGQDLNRKKKQYADKPKAGDNPMATEDIELEGRLAALYNSLKITTK